MSELPSIKIKHILPTGEFDEDEYILKSVAEAALDERDSELLIMHKRIKELEAALEEVVKNSKHCVECSASYYAEKALKGEHGTAKT